MTPRALAPLLALLVLALPAAASPTPAAASSDACLPAAGDAWGPAVAGACSASFQGGLAVACGETCRVVLSGRATASSAAPTGARVAGWLAHGDVAPCASEMGDALPPCGEGTKTAQVCAGVVDLGFTVSCSGTAAVDLDVPPGGCAPILVGATGQARLAVRLGSGPPTVVSYGSAFAQLPYAVVRAEDGTATVAPGAC